MFTAAFYSFCLTLWLITTSEVFRNPTGEPLPEESRDLSHYRIKNRAEEEASPFFQKLPGTNWTLYDIRFGDISDRQQIVGVPGKLNFPEGAESEVNLMELEMEEERKENGGLGMGNKGIGNFGSKNRSTGSHVLVYNRVPKCASETMLSIIRLPRLPLI